MDLLTNSGAFSTCLPLTIACVIILQHAPVAWRSLSRLGLGYCLLVLGLVVSALCVTVLYTVHQFNDNKAMDSPLISYFHSSLLTTNMDLQCLPFIALNNGNSFSSPLLDVELLLLCLIGDGERSDDSLEYRCL